MIRAAGARELLDGSLDDRHELERNLGEIARANRWFGGIAPIVREVRACGARTVLDVGIGGGDVPRALLRDASRRGSELIITGLDRSDAILAIARERAEGESRIRFVRAEGERLPFDDGAFDAAICTLTLHHLEPPGAIAVLRELRRVARVRAIVGDVVRSRVALGASWLFAHLLTRSPLTRHDAPLSVRRAYTPPEALALAHAAGWTQARVRAEPFFRMTLTDG